MVLPLRTPLIFLFFLLLRKKNLLRLTSSLLSSPTIPQPQPRPKANQARPLRPRPNTRPPQRKRPNIPEPLLPLGCCHLSSHPDPELNPLASTQFLTFSLKVFVPFLAADKPEWQNHLALRLLNPQAGPLVFVAKVPLKITDLERHLIAPRPLGPRNPTTTTTTEISTLRQLQHELLDHVLPHQFGRLLREYDFQISAHLQLSPLLHLQLGTVQDPELRLLPLVKELTLPEGWMFYNASPRL